MFGRPIKDYEEDLLFTTEVRTMLKSKVWRIGKLLNKQNALPLN